MQLDKVQHLLARICTDAVSRELFFNDRDRFFREYDPDAQAKSILSELKREQVKFFAQSLFAKRYHAVVQLLPGTRQFAGNLFREWFGEYAATFTPTGIHKHQEDAIAFLEWLFRGKKLQGLQAELANFEKEQLQSFLHPARWKARCYRIHPLRALQQMSNGSVAFFPGFTIIVWRKGTIRKVISLRARSRTN